MKKTYHAYQSLGYYADDAKSKTDSDLNYALSDIREALKCWAAEPTSNPYVGKLLNERDAYITELAIRKGDGYKLVRVPI